MNGFSIDYMVDITSAKEVIGKKTAIIGNVSPINTLWMGSPEKVKKEAKECIHQGVDVLALGCGFSPLTPLENMRALTKTAKDHGGR